MTPAAAADLDRHQGEYRQALVGAQEILRARRIPPAARAANATSLLRQGAPGEVGAIAALTEQPPRFAEAETRIDAALAAMNRSASDPDPGASQARLRQILSEPRYHPDEGPVGFLRNLVYRFLQWLTQPGAAPVKWALLLLLAGVVLLAIFLLVPALQGPLARRRSSLGRGPGGGADPLPEYFGDAEALAARGDHAGAVRALAAGTMELISGTRSFSASPLTVREAFGRSGAALALRPLLLAFERSYYGHHGATSQDYLEAAAAAHGYREARAGEGMAA